MRRPNFYRESPIYLGGIIVVADCIFTVQNLNDTAFRHVFLPGMLLALPLLMEGLIWQYTHIANGKRRHRGVLKSHRL